MWPPSKVAWKYPENPLRKFLKLVDRSIVAPSDTKIRVSHENKRWKSHENNKQKMAITNYRWNKKALKNSLTSVPYQTRYNFVKTRALDSGTRNPGFIFDQIFPW